MKVDLIVAVDPVSCSVIAYEQNPVCGEVVEDKQKPTSVIEAKQGQVSWWTVSARQNPVPCFPVDDNQN